MAQKLPFIAHQSTVADYDFAVRTVTKMRVARVIASILQARREPFRTVIRRGIHWHLDLREAIDLSIYITGRFQAGVIRQLTQASLSSGDVLDIGANRGATVVHLATELPNRRIFAIEPVPELVKQIELVIRDNPHLGQRVVMVPYFLTDELGLVPKQVDASWNVFSERVENGITLATAMNLNGVDGLTLDEVVQRYKIARVAAIKIDVEGYELNVLRGGLRTLRGSQPLILMEWQPSLQRLRGLSEHSLVETLTSLGYEPYLLTRLKRLRHITWPDLLERFADGYREIILKCGEESA